MDIKKIDENFYIFLRQLVADDLPRLKKMGIQTIICNRPDGEVANQPTFEDISEQAQKLGLRAVFIPVSPLGISAFLKS